MCPLLFQFEFSLVLGNQWLNEGSFVMRSLLIHSYESFRNQGVELHHDAFIVNVLCF
jgi:hypothetical protein